MPGPTLAGATQALDSSLNTIYSEFLLLRDESGTCRKVSTHYKLLPHTGISKNILNYGRLSAYSLQDGVDMAQAQTLSDTNTAYTPAEVCVQVIVPGSTLRRVADPTLMKQTAAMMHNAYDLKEDSDGTAQFTSFVPILGSAGTVLGVGHLLAARARLGIGNDRTNPEPAPAPYYAVLHPLHLSAVMGRLMPITDVPTGTNVYTGVAAGATMGIGGGTVIGDRIIESGPKAIGRLFDMEVYTDANMAIASDGASGACFAKMGLIYVSEVEPMMEPDETDVSLRAVELNLWGSYVWGNYRASNYGVEMLFDVTLPTA